MDASLETLVTAAYVFACSLSIPRSGPQGKATDQELIALAVAQAGDGLGDRQRDQLLIGGLALRSGTRDRQRAGEHVGCGDEGLQGSVHLVLQSRGCRAGDPLLISMCASCLGGQPASSL